jgi:hypothetical protein
MRSNVLVAASLALLNAAGCKGSVPKVGAELHAPGPVALFTGVVLHGTGTIRPYLAVGNVRSEELRLIDLTDDEVVASPGIVFPLSVPVTGRPAHLVAANLQDGRPDALVVVSEGSPLVQLIDTWTGNPTVVQELDLGAGAQVLAVAAAPRPDGAGGAVAGVVRFVVALAGGRAAVIEATRPDPSLDALSLALVTPAPYLDLGLDALSLAQGGAPGFFLYAATRAPMAPGAVQGVARIDLPASLAGWDPSTGLRPLDAHAPTVQVAVARLAPFRPASQDFDPDRTKEFDRVVAIPDPDGCGEGKTIRCGLVAVDVDPLTGAGSIAAKPAGLPDTDGWLQPIPIPGGAVVALAASGRPAASIMPVASTAGLIGTTGVALVLSSDGQLYPVDVARWAFVSNTSSVTGASRAQATGATVVGGAGSSLGLWSLDGATLSAAAAELPARVRVTPGFTPDDLFTLEWQGALPALSGRAALLGRDGTGYWLGIQAGQGTGAVSVARLASLGVQAGDLVEVGASGGCAAEELVVASVDAAVADAPGGAVRFTAPPACSLSVGSVLATSATLRGPGLVLSGAAAGLVGRPSVSPVETDFAGPRLFYVPDACPTGQGLECEALWMAGLYGGPHALSFPYPTGPRIGLAPGFLDASGASTATPPSRGTAISVRTISGQSPSVRHPILSGAAVASTVPGGLLLADGQAPGIGAEFYATYTSGLALRSSTASAPGTMTVFR